MKVAVSYDKNGEILTLFNPEKMTSKKMTLTYVPAKGERHEIIDLPKEFERKAFTELPNLLRVGVKSGKANFEKKG